RMHIKGIIGKKSGLLPCQSGIALFCNQGAVEISIPNTDFINISFKIPIKMGDGAIGSFTVSPCPQVSEGRNQSSEISCIKEFLHRSIYVKLCCSTTSIGCNDHMMPVIV